MSHWNCPPEICAMNLEVCYVGYVPRWDMSECENILEPKNSFQKILQPINHSEKKILKLENPEKLGKIPLGKILKHKIYPKKIREKILKPINPGKIRKKSEKNSTWENPRSQFTQKKFESQKFDQKKKKT